MNKKLENIQEKGKVLARIRNKNIGLIAHRNADPDAIASLIVLKHYLEDLKNNVFILLPEGLSSVSRNMITKLGIKLEFFNGDFFRYIDHIIDLYIIVDTNNPGQLKNLSKVIERKYILIDHHKHGKLHDYSWITLWLDTVSTSEIIYLLLRDKWWFNKICSTILLTGILYDSRRFLYIDPYVFHIVIELVNIYDADYSLALNSLKKKIDLSERIARLKAIRRTKLFRTGKHVIACTHVGSYESSVARSLIELGADLVFVVSGKEKNILRITGRSTMEFVINTGVSIGRDLMPRIAELIKGEGGGHDTAGSAEGYGDIEYGFNVLVKILSMFFKDLRPLN